ncbi:MAG: D-alanyl-D-alanine carboxypeptidase/D-alanyl-D-alanine-endopeptidase [Pseudobdellovibrionaceae bacterium]
MHRSRTVQSWLIVVVCLLLAESSRASKTEAIWQKEIKNKLSVEIKKSKAAESDFGILIQTGEGEDEATILSINAERPMSPASVTKLATGAAALTAFPPGTKFKTKLMSSARIEKGVLKGDLYLVGDGDPSFVSETMWYLVNVLTRSQIRTIEGNIVVDDTKFDKLRYDPSRSPERVDRAYDSPVGAMSFNWNAVNIFIRPGKEQGDVAQVFVDPENEYIRLVGKVSTGRGNSKDDIAVSRVETKDFWGDVISVGGKTGIGLKEVVIFKNVTSPDLWAGGNLKSFLAQRGIETKGKVTTGQTPAGATLLAESEGSTIERILADMNKFSNNFVAEMITKNISAKRKTPGTIDDGMKAIEEYLLSLKIPREQFSLTNPSGLTRDNKISANALNRILEEMKHDFQYQPEFLTSLPIGGIDGTLKNRMRNTAATRWVRAKTGSINQVVSLAGYAGRKDGHVLTFSFIYNGNVSETVIRGLFDKMAAVMVSAGE